MARPRIYKERVARTVRLEPEIIRFYEQFGKGNFNEGVRQLALECMAQGIENLTAWARRLGTESMARKSVSIIEERKALLYASIKQSRRAQSDMEAIALSEIERLESLKRSLEEMTDG